MRKPFLLFFIIVFSSLLNAQDFYSQKVVSCSAGTYHSLVIDDSGNLWAWGRNSGGQIGNGTTIEKSTPELIMSGTKFKAVSTSWHSMAIDETGNLWAWGYNPYGELGDGTKIDKNTPVQIKSGTKFKSVSAGWAHSLAIDESGNLWGWGNNSSGELGDGTNIDTSTPIQIKPGTKFISISAGGDHSMAIDESGNLWTMGLNVDKQLCDGTTISTSIPIVIMSGTKFKFISAGTYHSLAIDEAGNLWVSGRLYLLGVEDLWGAPSPVNVKPGTKFLLAAAGNDYSMAIDESRNLWAWGGNGNGQLGDGTTIGSYKAPENIMAGARFKTISTGIAHSIAIEESGNIWTWGNNVYGQTGDGTTLDETKPGQIKPETKFSHISCGDRHTISLDESGNLWYWGMHYKESRLYEDITDNNSKPQLMLSNLKYKAISAGLQYALAIDASGQLWAWGWNSYGVLGDGTIDGRISPIKIKTGTKFKAISAGGWHSLAIDESGNLWAWGHNINGELGDGTTIDRLIPTQIMVGTKFRMVSAAISTHSIAIDESGGLWVWGAHGYGPADEGSVWAKSITPIQIMPGTKFTYASAGSQINLVIDESGFIWSWGENSYGGLGDGTMINSFVLVKVMAGVKFKIVSASATYCLALDDVGNLWAWGYNYSGQFTPNTNLLPIQIKTGTKYKSISVGGSFSSSFCSAIDDTGGLWTWGMNDYGQLGTGTDAWREIPYWINNLNSPNALMELDENVDINVYGYSHQIKVHSTNSKVYSIYNLLGSKVVSGRLQSGETNIGIQPGLYIFSTANYKCKVLVN